MEAPIFALIEKHLYEKIMLYNDLLHCFRQESESLLNIDLDKLWQISKEKEEICANIRAARHEIMAAVGMQGDQKSFDLNRIMALIPRDGKAEFQKLYLRLIKLKSETEVYRKENMIFVNDDGTVMSKCKYCKKIFGLPVSLQWEKQEKCYQMKQHGIIF